MIVASGSLGCAAIILAAGLLLGGCTMATYGTDHGFATRAVSARARVLSESPEGDSDNGGAGESVARVRFTTTEGREVTATVIVHGDRNSDGTLTVGYDPRRPSHVVNPPPDHSPEAGVLLTGGIAVLLILLSLVVAAAGPLEDRRASS